MLEICGCGAGAGKISRIPAGVGEGGFKFSGAGADKKFQPAQDSSRHRLKLIAEEIVISKQRTEAVYSGCASALWPTAETVNVSLERDHAQRPPLSRRIGQLLKLIRQTHSSKGMYFTHLLITSLAKWIDTSQMK